MKKIVTMLILAVAIVMMAGVAQAQRLDEFVDFADEYAKADANIKPWLHNAVVEGVGTNAATILQANGYVHADIIDACIAADSVRGVRSLLHHRFSSRKNYYDKVITGITNGVMTWNQHTDYLLMSVTEGNESARKAAYTWVAANQDASQVEIQQYPSEVQVWRRSPNRRRIDWNMKARGDKAYSIAENIELMSVNEDIVRAKTKSDILQAMVPIIRAKMMEDGVPFVGVAGRSNMLERVNVVIAQLDDGLISDGTKAFGDGSIEETLRSYNVACPDMDRTAMVTRCTTLLPKIMDGTVVPTRKHQQLLQNVLGTVEYEKWRVAYNTGGSYIMQ
jgi:hypothetical protein